MASVFEKYNLKKTKNRQHILKIVKEHKLPISAEEIYKKCLSESLNINLSTIYRTLSLLESVGVLCKQVYNHGVAYYQENTDQHTHMFICTNCKQNFTTEICTLENEFKRLAQKQNFELVSHSVQLYGFCKHCKVG